MYFGELLDDHEVLGYFMLDSLPNLVEFLINDFVHEKSNIFKLPVTILKHFLWIFWLVEYSKFSQQLIDDLDKFRRAFASDTLETLDVQVIKTSFLVMKQVLLDTLRAQSLETFLFNAVIKANLIRMISTGVGQRLDVDHRTVLDLGNC